MRCWNRWAPLSVAALLLCGAAALSSNALDLTAGAQDAVSVDPERPRAKGNTGHVELRAPEPFDRKYEAELPSQEPDVSASTTLRRYEKWAQYPPSSRPLRAEQLDLIEPHIVHVAPTQLFRQGDDGDLVASDYFCTLQPLTHNVVAGDPLSVTLSCSRGERPERGPIHVAVEVTAVTLLGKGGGQEWSAPVTSRFEDDGRQPDRTAGDLTYTLELAPPSDRSGDALLTVELVIPSESPSPREPYRLRAAFNAAGNAPARFTGNFADQAEGGSLVVDVELSVDQGGSYRVMANLFSGHEPVAYAEQTTRLAPGVHKVPLTFFGKILHDSELDGPYRVTALRGYRLNTGIDPEDLLRPAAEVDRLLASLPKTSGPDRQMIAPFADEHVTGAYDSSEFSDAEWQSPLKSRRIAELGALEAREAKSGGSTQP